MVGHMCMRGWRSVTALLVLSVIFSRLLVRGDQALFTYSDFGLDWNGTCKDGQRQSPINVEKSLFTRAPSSPPVPAGTFGTGTNVSVQHLGNQVKVAWKQATPSTVTMTLGAFYAQPNATGVIKVPGTDTDAGDADTVMSVSPVQFHFHINSEHTLGGRYSTMETHLVTNVSAANTSCPVSKPCNAVYGVLYDYSADGLGESNFLATIFDNIPEPNGTTTSKTFLGDDFTLQLADYFPEDTSRYIQYTGSLTTPPCSENILWTVFEASRPVSFAQTEQLSRALADAVIAGLVATRTDNRFPQLVNDRIIWEFNTAEPETS
ncbi:hypothetical protein ABBQ32_013416 [Trebouxia sp. C0010 RCD-2024]